MIAPIPGMAPPIPTNRSPAYFTITPPMAEPAAIPKLKKTEIREEARFTTDLIAKYKITYPVAYNCEGFQDAGNRQYALSQTERTGLACAFLDEVAAAGYTPMFYASRNELAGNASWDTDILASRYKIWLAWYPSVMTEQADYSGSYAMWQYTCQGTVDGISGKTDINTAYFSYTKEAEAKDDTPAERVTVNPEVGINFTEVNETVTAKQETNLRTEPSTASDDTIVGKLHNGEALTRIATGDNGWSQLEYNGQTVYAVSSYLMPAG